MRCGGLVLGIGKIATFLKFQKLGDAISQDKKDLGPRGKDKSHLRVIIVHRAGGCWSSVSWF